MLRLSLMLLLLATVCAHAICAPKPGILFKVPVGWLEFPRDRLGDYPEVVGVWFSPKVTGRFRQNINVQRLGVAEPINLYVDTTLAELKGENPTVHILERHLNSVCVRGSSEVVVISSHSQSSTLVMEQVFTSAENRIFIGTYSRSADDAPSSAAKASIEHLCPIR